MPENNKKPTMSDLERINRSYSTGGQSYTPSRHECEREAPQSEDQQDPKRDSQHRPLSQE
jgi:hypothetical protein